MIKPLDMLGSPKAPGTLRSKNPGDAQWAISREIFMSKTNLARLAFNAKFGDGGLYKSYNKVRMQFTSTSEDFLNYKRTLGEGANVSRFRSIRSGYSGSKKIFTFSIYGAQEAVVEFNKSIDESISTMDKLDLWMWIMDDGSLHRTHGTLHLYCNTLTDAQAISVASKIYNLYGYKSPVLRHDKKKDGRSFPYLYIPRIVAELIQIDMEKFMLSHGITSLLYKVARKYTLNDHRKAKGRPPEMREATFEPSRVGEVNTPKQEDK